MRSASLIWSKIRDMGSAMIKRCDASMRTSPTISSNPTSPRNDIEAKRIRASLPKVAKNGLHQLHELLDPSHRSAATPRPSDVVFIAIDFENIDAIRSGLTAGTNCEAGIAILDTRELKKAPAEKLIKTRNLIVSTPLYVAKASDRFLFGNSIAVAPSKLAESIHSFVPRNRNLVFVGHGVMNDLLALQAMGFRFPSSVVAVLDTLEVANAVFGCQAGPLRKLLRKLDCPYNRLHCAGNDANFTLKALLLLAAKRLEEQDRDEQIVKMLQRIGRQKLSH